MAEEELSRQLRGIDAASPAGAASGTSLCLYRVVEGMGEADWLRLRRELSLSQWQAAPPELLLAGARRSQTDEARLRRFLRSEMDRARHCQQPVALALVEPEQPGALHMVFGLIRAQLRSFDHAGLLESGPVAVVLSGTPLASAERQLGAMLRRIRQVGETDLVCSAGLAGYGGLAELSAQALLDTALAVLSEARKLGGNRLEVAPSADAQLASRETLVRASEKHFLFTGKKLEK